MFNEEKIDQLLKEIDKLTEEGKAKDTIPVYEELLRVIKDNIFGCENQYIQVLNDFGGVLRYSGFFDRAKECFIESLEFTVKLYGEYNANNATILMNLAGVYRLEKDYDKAAKTMLIAKSIYEKTVGKEDFLYLSLLNNLGLVYISLNDKDQAYQCISYCLDYYKNHIKGNEILYAITVNNYSQIEGIAEEEKLSMLLEAENILKDAKINENDSCYINLYNNIATSYFKNNQYEKALSYQESSMKKLLKTYGKTSPYYKAGAQNLEAICEKLGKKDDFQNILMRIENEI